MWRIEASGDSDTLLTLDIRLHKSSFLAFTIKKKNLSRRSWRIPSTLL